MNGGSLNLQGKTRVIKIDHTSILNDDGMIACGFLCELHLQKFT